MQAETGPLHLAKNGFFGKDPIPKMNVGMFLSKFKAETVTSNASNSRMTVKQSPQDVATSLCS
jgi:hypothetical protein